MRLSFYATLFLFGLVVALLVATFQSAPGYMDADYYYATGRQIATGHGFSDPFVWNYLDDPQGLPHPSFTYWMPLAGLVAALGMKLTGGAVFSSARLGSILLFACVPPLTAALAYSITPQRWAALLAGLLALFPGYYLAFMTTTDTFAISMVCGVLFLQLAQIGSNGIRDQGSGVWSEKANNQREWIRALGIPFLMGLMAGLMHLARADGVIWLVVGVIVISIWSSAFSNQRLTQPGSLLRFYFSRIMPLILNFTVFFLGYLVIMTPWMLRNYDLFRSFLSPVNGRILWITAYDEIFAYPASILTPARWWASGLGEILKTRCWAIGQNLQTILAVQGEIFLAPLILIGIMSKWNDRRVQLGLLAGGWIFILMTLVFPYPGVRGGLFHSGAALQPLFWALVPVGLAGLIAWGQKRRGWDPGQARPVLAGGIVFLAILMTILTTWPKLNSENPASPGWGQVKETYFRLEKQLDETGALPADIVMVNNPPGYNAATGRSAIVIPNGGIQTTLAAAERYQARYILLEKNHPQGLAALYLQPGDQVGLHYLVTVDGIHVFKVVDN